MSKIARIQNQSTYKGWHIEYYISNMGWWINNVQWLE